MLIVRSCHCIKCYVVNGGYYTLDLGRWGSMCHYDHSNCREMDERVCEKKSRSYETKRWTLSDMDQHLRLKGGTTFENWEQPGNEPCSLLLVYTQATKSSFYYKWEEPDYKVIPSLIWYLAVHAESEDLQSSEAAGETATSSEPTGLCVTGSQGKDIPSSMQIPASLGGLGEMEKQRLVEQYGCESDEDCDYTYPHKIYHSHLVINVSWHVDL